MTLPTALAAPVAEGMMFCEAQRPPRQSLPPREGPSTVNWVAVIACTVVMRPSTMPNLSFTTFASGARQLVVHEALLTTGMSVVYSVWFTPQTNIGTSSFAAKILTVLPSTIKQPSPFSTVPGYILCTESYL